MGKYVIRFNPEQAIEFKENINFCKYGIYTFYVARVVMIWKVVYFDEVYFESSWIEDNFTPVKDRASDTGDLTLVLTEAQYDEETAKDYFARMNFRYNLDFNGMYVIELTSDQADQYNRNKKYC